MKEKANTSYGPGSHVPFQTRVQNPKRGSPARGPKEAYRDTQHQRVARSQGRRRVVRRIGARGGCVLEKEALVKDWATPQEGGEE